MALPHFSGQVDATQMEACLERVRKLLEEVEPGLRVLTDLSGLELMDTLCAPVIGNLMDYLGEKHVASIVRVIPDPRKDIGFSLMSKFHYASEVRTMTFETLADAIQHLAPSQKTSPEPHR